MENKKCTKASGAKLKSGNDACNLPKFLPHFSSLRLGI